MVMLRVHLWDAAVGIKFDYVFSLEHLPVWGMVMCEVKLFFCWSNLWCFLISPFVESVWIGQSIHGHESWLHDKNHMVWPCFVALFVLVTWQGFLMPSAIRMQVIMRWFWLTEQDCFSRSLWRLMWLLCQLDTFVTSATFLLRCERNCAFSFGSL